MTIDIFAQQTPSLLDLVPTLPPEVVSGAPMAWVNEASTFAGWGTTLGTPVPSISVKIYVRSWDAGNLISRVRLRIRQGDHTGVIVYDGEVAITPTYNVVQECEFLFDTVVGDGASLHWIEFYTNGRCGLLPTSGAITGSSRGYTTSTTAIDLPNPTLSGVAANASVMHHVIQPQAVFDINTALTTWLSDFLTDTDRLNTFNLRQFWRKAALIDYGDVEMVRIAVIGDSWTNAPHRITSPLLTRLSPIYGDAGYGWVGASTGEDVPSGSVTRTYGGSWTYTTGLGPAIHHAVSGATGATVAFTATSVTSWKIHYRTQATGGDFRWRVAGGSWNAVDTAAAAAAVVITATGAGNLEIEVTAQDASGVILLGVEAYIASTGVLIHKLGYSGATAQTFLDANATNWQQVITNLAVDTAVICLGTNDMSHNVPLADYVTRMAAIAARVRAANPTADILFLSPSDNGLTGRIYTMRQYSDALADYARANGEAWLDLWRLFGDYTDTAGQTLITRLMYQDSVHPSLRGGRAIGRLLAELFGGV
jgi:lysophospholipase L1-like esterase